jgi:transposase
MESTGTYGDALRQALTDAGLAVHRVSGKAASDYAEVFDGVPSAHDGKDAAVIAELAGIGKSSPWPVTKASPVQSQMAAEVLWLDTQQSVLLGWLGRRESLLARHWPEATRLLKLNSGTLLAILATYGSPAALAADSEGRDRLTSWSRGFWTPQKIQAVLASARQTVGVRMDEATIERVQRAARAAMAARAEISQAKRKLASLAKEDPVVQAQAPAVGTTTACVLRVTVGNPHDYSCGGAYRKALGLNLKVRSSGKHEGRLKITKRGPAWPGGGSTSRPCGSCSGTRCGVGTRRRSTKIKIMARGRSSA